MIFPTKEWMRCAPEEQGFDAGLIEEIGAVMRKAEANGVLIRNGFLAAEWNYGGPRTAQFHAMSIGKSFTSLVLGLALEDGLIPSLDAKVKDLHPAFDGGPFTERITFRHLATMTAGIKSSRHQLNYTKLLPPDVALVYHADHCAYLARALTYLYGRTLHSVLKERILDPVGAGARWEIDEPPWSPVTANDGKEIPVNTGYGAIHFTAADLARVGHLCANYGAWKDRQLVAADYLRACWTPIPYQDLRPHKWGEKYGLYWWSCAPGVWHMAGWGGQFCMVWPECGLVMVKLNAASEDHTALDGAKNLGLRDVYPLLHRSLTGKEFAVPLEWRIGRRATGSDGVWEIKNG